MNNSSTRESVNCLFLLTLVFSQGKFSPRHGSKGTKVSTCGGVVGADEPLQVGSSSFGRARVVSLTAANGGPAPVLPAGPAAGENENDR